MKRFAFLLFAVLVFAGCAQVTTDSSGNTIGLEVGQVGPVFEVTTVEGEVLNSDELRGKVVFFTSIASWCPTCIASGRHFTEVYETVDPDEVVFINVSIDKSDAPEKLAEFDETTGNTWHSVLPDEGQDLIINYVLQNLDTTYMLDKKGVVRLRHIGVTTVDQVQEALAESL